MGDTTSESGGLECPKAPRSLNAVLGEVVHIHTTLMKNHESEIEKLKMQVQNTEREKSSLQERYVTLQEECERMANENTTVKKMLEERNNKPCAKCKENEQKVRSTEKLHKNLFKMLRKSVAGTGSLDADTLYTQLTEECTEAHTDEHSDLVNHSDNMEVTKRYPPDVSSHKPKAETTGHEVSSSMKVGPPGGDNVVVVSDGSEGGLSQEKIGTRKEKNCHKKGQTSSAQLSVIDSVDPGSKEDISPNSTRRLKLAKTAKRARVRYTEEPMPSCKRPRPAEENSEFKRPDPKPRPDPKLQPDLKSVPDLNRHRPFETDKTLPTEADPEPPTILVSETLLAEHTFVDESKSSRERRKGVVWRPNIVIPETVPMDFDCGEDESDSQQPDVKDCGEDESDSQQPEESHQPESLYDPTQNSMAHVVFSPPSYTSTPAVFSRTHTRRDPDASPLKVIFTEMSESQCENHALEKDSKVRLSMSEEDDRGARLSMKSDSEDSLPSSPVFGHGKDSPAEIRHMTEVGHMTNFAVRDSPIKDSPIKDSPVNSPIKTFTLPKPESVPLFDDEQDSKEETVLTMGRKGIERLRHVSFTDMQNANQSGDRSGRRSLLSETNTSAQSIPSPSVLSGKIVSLTGKGSERASQTSQSSGMSLPPTERANQTSHRSGMSLPPAERANQTSQRSGMSLPPRSKRSPTRLKLKSTRNLVKTSEDEDDNDSWLSTKRKSSGPKLKQTTLSQFPFASKGAYSPANDEDFIHADDDELKRAKQESLKEYQRQEDAQRKIIAAYMGENSQNQTNHSKGSSNLTKSPNFKKPHSPYKPSTPKRSKKPLHMMENLRKSPRLNKVRSDSEASAFQNGSVGRASQRMGSLQDIGSLQGSSVDMTTIPGPREMNGTIDPGVRLSQYDTPAEDSDSESLRPITQKSQYLEPVSVLEMDIQAMEDDEDEMVENSPPSRPRRSLRSTQGSSGSQGSNVTRSQRSKVTGSQQAGTSPSTKRASGKKSTRKSEVIMPHSPSLEIIEDNLEESSMQSAIFGPTKSRSKPRSDDFIPVMEEEEYELDSPQKGISDYGPDMSLTAAVKEAKKAFRDSFNRVPKKKEPDYAYKEVVRKQSERRQLDAKACVQCDKYFSDLGLDEAEKRERMKNCRHKAKFLPPDTPEHFWSVGFPDTQECQERGIVHTAETKPSKYRRKRGLKALFLDEKDQAISKKDNDED